MKGVKMCFMNYLALVYKLHSLLYKVPLLSGYTEMIRRRQRMLHPESDDTVIIQTTKMVIRTIGLSISIFVLIITFYQVSFYSILLLIYLIVLVNQLYAESSLRSHEYYLLKDFESYLGDVRHCYTKGAMVEDAIYDSMELLNERIGVHIQAIYNVLLEDDMECIELYIENAPSKYMVTFLALSRVTMVYGDIVKSDESLFLTNINSLRDEINVEILRQDKSSHVFSGLIFICMLPVCTLQLIENWGISNLVELVRYYKGSYGFIVTILIFICSFFSFQTISILKGRKNQFRSEHRILERIVHLSFIKQLLNRYCYFHALKAHRLNRMLKHLSSQLSLQQYLIQRCLYFIVGFIFSIFIINHVISLSRSHIIHGWQDGQGISWNLQDSKSEKLELLMEDFLVKYKHLKSEEALRFAFAAEMGNYNISLSKHTEEIILDELMERIHLSQGIRYRLWYLPIHFIIGILFFYLPKLLLAIRKLLLSHTMEDEVIQFQTILMMLIPIKSMDVLTILEWMERFGEIFKESLMDCVDYFYYDEDLALEKLKEEEPFLPFVRLIENMEASDFIGVEKAFNELAQQRKFHMSKRKQENEIQIVNLGAIGRIVAYIPVTLTLAFYLIIPFIAESMSQFAGFMKQLQQLY